MALYWKDKDSKNFVVVVVAVVIVIVVVVVVAIVVVMLEIQMLHENLRSDTFCLRKVWLCTLISASWELCF